jgi:iron complex transport system substrate-binding protein
MTSNRNTGLRGLLATFATLLALLAPHSAAAGQASALDTSRIVSVGGDVTEILYALGLEDKIVAIDSTSVFPADALKTKKNLGYMRALSTEGVLSAAPTLIIASAKAGPPDVVAALKSNSVPYVAIDGADSPDGVGARIRAVASAVGASAKADEIIAASEKAFKELADQRAQIRRPARVLFLLSAQNGRATAAGTKTAADEVIKLAGGENVAAVLEGYKPLSDEAAAAMAPDVILVMNRSQQPGQSQDPLEKQIQALKGLSNSPAVRNNRVVEVDGAALLQFGPRTASAARDLIKVLHRAPEFTAGGQ